MKNSILNRWAFLALILVFTSCDTDDQKVDEKITAEDIASITEAVTAGEWMITYYFDGDTEETNDYINYTFTFNADGTLSATNGSASVSGAWSILSSDSSNDDSDDNDVDFNIFFTSPAILEELADDWDIEKYTSNSIELIDVSGGDGSIDNLKFEKKQ